MTRWLLWPQNTGAQAPVLVEVPLPFSIPFCSKSPKIRSVFTRGSRDRDFSCSLPTLWPTSRKQDMPSLITDHSLLERPLFAKTPMGKRRQPERRCLQAFLPALAWAHTAPVLQSSIPDPPSVPDLFTQCLRSTSSSASHLRVRNGCFLLIISPSKNVVRVGYSWQRGHKAEVTIVTHRHKPKS